MSIFFSIHHNIVNLAKVYYTKTKIAQNFVWSRTSGLSSCIPNFNKNYYDLKKEEKQKTLQSKFKTKIFMKNEMIQFFYS